MKHHNFSKLAIRALKRNAKTPFAPLYRFNKINKRLFTAKPMIDTNKVRTFLVGVDGTKYGYLALEHAFSLSNPNDKIIGMHIPLDPDYGNVEFQDPLVYTNVFHLTEKDIKNIKEKKYKLTSKIERKSHELNEMCNKSNAHFEFIIYDDGKNKRSDLVNAVKQLDPDYLVIGSKGVATSITEQVMYKKIIYIIFITFIYK